MNYSLHILQRHFCRKGIWRTFDFKSLKDVINLRSSVSPFHIVSDAYRKECNTWVVFTYGTTSLFDPRKLRVVFLIWNRPLRYFGIVSKCIALKTVIIMSWPLILYRSLELILFYTWLVFFLSFFSFQVIKLRPAPRKFCRYSRAVTFYFVPHRKQKIQFFVERIFDLKCQLYNNVRTCSRSFSRIPRKMCAGSTHKNTVCLLSIFVKSCFFITQN